MSSTTVSIVIVNWKTPQLLARCLDSMSKDHEKFEIWVVDNNSGDESVEMLRTRFPYVKVIANDDNLGFSKACNQAIPDSKGQYVLLLNPDTEIEPDAVTILAQFLDTHPECGAVGPKVLNSDGSLQLACRRAFPSPAAAFYRITYLSRIFPNNPTFSQYNFSSADPNEQLEVDALSGSCMMVRRQAIDQVGLLDEDIFMFGEDIDWCWRIKQAKWKVFYVPESVIYHVHGASSRLRPVGATINLHKGMEVFYKKHLAQKYWAPFNALVYAAIWSRAGLFILINLGRGLAKGLTARVS
jgi:GT2 family glycosyltransferase